MKKLRELAVPALLLVIVLLLLPQRARSVYSSPVSVVNADVQSAAVNDAPRQPVEFGSGISICGGVSNTDSSLSVPAGKSLVVDTITAAEAVPTGEHAYAYFVANGFTYYFPMAYQTSLFGSDFYSSNQRTHIVLHPGTVTVTFYRQGSAGCAGAGYTFSGHYIDQ